MAADSSGPGPAHAEDHDFVGAEDDRLDDRSRMGFLDHLDELRRRLLYSLYVLIVCCAASFFYWQELYLFYTTYFTALGGQMMFSRPMAGFMFSLKISGLAGLIVGAPFIFAQAWLFVAPGLYAREKRVVVPFVVLSSALFFLGAFFAHEIAFPSMWRFFASYEMGGVEFRPMLDDAFAFYVKVILALGLIFQMPIAVFFLARFGVVTAGFMLRNIKYAVLLIVILAAVITPSGDPVNLAVFSAPMLVLYVISIGVAWLSQKKRPAGDEA